MNDSTFSRLAPFIQEYIYTHNWTELRPIQIEACQAIFDTDAHVLLAGVRLQERLKLLFCQF